MNDIPSPDDKEGNDRPSEVEQLTFSTKLAYGAGDLGSAVTANILVFFLLYFFTNVAGLSAGLASLILAIGKISDAINDPLTGILSDRTRTVWGRRIPWMLGGAIPFGLLFLLQWLVPHFSDNTNLNTWFLFTYYVIIAILFNLAFTAVNLPYTALTPELTQNYNERTGLNSFRMAFSIGGSIFSLILAQIVFGSYPDDPLTQYFLLGLVASLVSTIAIFWCTFRIQERGAKPLLSLSRRKTVGKILIFGGLGFIAFLSVAFFTKNINLFINVSGLSLGVLIVAFGWTLIVSKPEQHLVDENAVKARSLAQDIPSIPFGEQLKIVLSTKPFLYLIGIYLFSWLAVQLVASIMIYFVVSWMGMKEGDFPLVAIAIQGTALGMLFVWKKVSDRFGKKTVYFLGASIWLVEQALLFMVKPGQVGLLYFCAVLAGIGVSVAYLIPWSMMPDIIEWDELKTGQRREGIFYGFMVLLQKLGLALALLIVGQSLDFAGFIERLPGEPIPIQPESALLAIRLAIAPLPALFLILGMILTYFYPITSEVHDRICLQLAERKKAQEN
ncbi:MULTISPECIES: MFS transporter [Spirulina sp. CCY15215]|uniref:MFS transporter n=1 Tax=Spirulina sp. CCY15215 TaxID=2767591 RepID=UPI00194F27AB